MPVLSAVIAPMINSTGAGRGAGAGGQVSAHRRAQLGRLHGPPGLGPDARRISARGQPHDHGLRHDRDGGGAGRPSTRSRRRPASTGCSSAPATCRSPCRRGPGSTRPGKQTLAAMEKVAAAARDNDLVAGAFGGSAEVIKAYLGLGFTFIAAAVDVDLLQTGAAALDEVAQGRLTSAAFRARLRPIMDKRAPLIPGHEAILDRLVGLALCARAPSPRRPTSISPTPAASWRPMAIRRSPSPCSCAAAWWPPWSPPSG